MYSHCDQDNIRKKQSRLRCSILYLAMAEKVELEKPPPPTLSITWGMPNMTVSDAARHICTITAGTHVQTALHICAARPDRCSAKSTNGTGLLCTLPPWRQWI